MKLRTLMLEPRLKKSNTETREPSLTVPKIDALEPNLQNERTDIILPICTVSKALNALPNLMEAKMDNAEPSRVKLLTLKELPVWA